MSTKKYVSLSKLTKYDELLKAKMAADDAAVLASAKEFASGLASNYDAAGSAATAETNAIAAAKTETTTQVNALANGAVKSNTDAIAAIKDSDTIDSFADVEAALAGKQATGDYATKAEAQGYADAKDEAIAAAQAAGDAAQSEVDALETYVGTFTHDTAKTVVEYINAKTDGIATSGNLEALGTRVTAVEGDVATIKGDYLKAADKTELSDAITAEADRAKGIEGGLETRLKAVEDDYLTSADAEALQTQINTIMNNPDAEGAINSINEFTQYIADHGTIADGFRADIDKNKEDIAAEVERATKAESALSGRLDTLEAVDHNAYVAADTALKNELTTEIGKKADASALTSAVEALEGADAEMAGKISALETKFGEGEGSVSDMISDAVSAERTLIDVELAKKVDKVEGKGLSTNDLTDALKGNYDAAYEHSQVAHAPANAQANVIESVKVNGAALTVTDKAVDITVPVDNAELTNGAGYLVASDIANKADKATTLAGYGITDAYTNVQVDTAITNAMAQFVEVSEEEIQGLFQ